MQGKKYTIADEQAIYDFRRVDGQGHSESLTAQHIGVPPGSIGTLLRRYETRLQTPSLLEKLVSAEGLCIDDLMIPIERQYPEVSQDTVQLAFDGKGEISDILLHAILKEYDPECEFLHTLTEEGDGEEESMKSMSPIDRMVDENYEEILKVIKNQLHNYVSDELDHLKVPVEALADGRDALTFEDVQNLFAELKSTVGEKIVERLMAQLTG